MPPQFVRPYVKTNKNDAADAEACCEAVQRRACSLCRSSHSNNRPGWRCTACAIIWSASVRARSMPCEGTCLAARPIASLAEFRDLAFRDAGQAHRLHQPSTRRVDTPPIQASWITVTSAFSAVLRSSRKGGKYEPWRSLGISQLERAQAGVEGVRGSRCGN